MSINLENFESRLPVNSKTPTGYAIAFCVETSGAIYTVCIGVPYFCLTLGSLWIIKTFVKDIANDLPTLNVSEVTDATTREVTERFGAIAQGLSDAKQLS